MRKFTSWISVALLVMIVGVFQSPIRASATDSFPVALTINNLPSNCQLETQNGSQVTFAPDDDGTGNFSATVNATCSDSRNLMLHATIQSNTQSTAVFNLPSVPSHRVNGNVAFSYPEACNGLLNWGADWAINNIQGQTASESISISGTSTYQTDSNGNFHVTVPDDVSVSLFGGPSYSSSDPMIMEKCRLDTFTRTFSSSQNSITLSSDVVHVLYQLDLPPSKASSCFLVDNYGMSDSGTLTNRYLPAGSKSSEEQVSCDGFVQTVVARAADNANVSAGHEYSMIVKVSDYDLVGISGTVNTTHSECLTSADLKVYGSSSEGFYVENIAVNPDGSFNANIPSGSWTFNILSQLPYGLCEATLTTFIAPGAASRSLTLNVTSAKLHLRALQPIDHIYPEGVSSCFIGETEVPEQGMPDPTNIAVPIGAPSFVVIVTCGAYQRSLRVPLPQNLNATTTNEIDVQIPSLQIRTITGKVKIPTALASSGRNQVMVTIYPVERDDFSTDGWSFPNNSARIVWDANKPTEGTYTVQVPVGSYNFGVFAGFDSWPAGGCYPNAYYRAGKSPTPAQQFATPISVVNGTASVTGPPLDLPMGGRVKSTFTWPEGVADSTFGFNLFNENRQQFIFNYGDGVQSSVGSYDYFLCLTPGTYYLKAVTSSKQVGNQFYGGVTDISKASPVVIGNDGSSKPLHFKLVKKQTGRISGILKDSQGHPITSGYTIYANSDAGQFYSAPVSDTGYFELNNLETPDTYSLVAASDAQFGGMGTGGTDFTFYPSSHSSSQFARIPLTNSNSTVSGINFTVTPNSTTTPRDQVVPWSRLGKQESPAISIEDMAAFIDSGAVAVDSSTVTISQNSGVATIDATSDFSAVADSYVDAYVLNPQAITASGLFGIAAAPTNNSTYLGRIAIDTDKVKISKAFNVGAGLNELVLVGTTTGKAKVLPVVAGRMKPRPVKSFQISGTLKANKTLTTAGIWIGNPSKISAKYSWSRCAKATSQCSLISGATKSTYKVSSKDVGKFLKVTVTANNSAGKSVTSQVTSRSISK